MGAAKSGTTALHVYLIQHPEIYMSVLKEPKHLSISANKFPHKGPGDDKVDDEIIKSRDEYLSLFANAQKEKVIGESSADYLYFYNSVIPSIKAICPNPKILIMLRNPTDRAYSAYRHMLMDKRENLTFEKALEREDKRMRENYEFIWHYKNVGFYYKQVEQYINSFGWQNVKVVLYDDFALNSMKIVRDIYKFLNVDEGFTPNTSEKYNVGPTVLSEPLEDFLIKYDHPAKKALRPILLNTIGKRYTEALVNYFIRRNRLSLNPETRKFLIETYREDISKLAGLINRDLSAWLT